MSIESTNPQEFSPTAANRAKVRERLETVRLTPEQMYEVAQDVAGGAELLGTNLTVEIGKRKTNPDKFSIDFSATSIPDPDGPNHLGYAKIFVPSVGELPMLAKEGERSFLSTLVSQWLKLHKKGYDTMNSDGVVVSRAGSIGNEAKDRLDRATSSIFWEVTEQLAAAAAGVDGYESELAARRAEQVGKWVGPDCSQGDAQAVFGDIVEQVTKALNGIIKE